MQIRTDANFSWAGNTYIETVHKTKIYENGLKVSTVEQRVYDVNLYSQLGTIQQDYLSGSTIDLLV